MRGLLLIVSLLLVGATFSTGIEERYDWKNPRYCRGVCPPYDNYHPTFLKHKECDKYCLCHAGTPTVMICPDGLHFNPRLQICDYPENAHCSYKSKLLSENFGNGVSVETATQPWQNPKTCKGKCPKKDNPDKVTLLENKDCNKFCMCHAGTPTVMECPEGLIFSLKDQTCAFPYDADCTQLP